MSREVDASDLSKLSKEDLYYLRDRGRLTPEQEREYLGGINADPPQERSVSDTPNTGTVNVNNTNPTNRNGKPDNIDEPGGGTQPEEVLPEHYDDWKVPQLEKEIARRNAERDGVEDAVIISPASGRKDDLISALAMDDEANAEDEEE